MLAEPHLAKAVGTLDEPAPAIDGGQEPMAIVHVLLEHSAEHPSEANGVYRVARQIAAEQARAGHIARLVIFREPPVDDGTKIVDGLEVSILPLAGPRPGGRRIWLGSDLVAGLVRGDPSRTIVHIHSGREPLLLSLCLGLKRRGVPYVVTVHGRYSHLFGADEQGGSRLSELYLRFVERPVLEGALFVHAVSHHERGVIRRIAPRAEIEVVPNAAGSVVASGVGSRRRWLGPPHRPRFGYLGRYAIHHKGLDLLLRGFSIYRAGGGRGRLDLHGTGSDTDKLTAIVRQLDLSSAVSVGAGCFGEDKERAFADWHYFVQPSRFEGSPIGPLEAALAGLPLIVTPGTGLDEDVRTRGAGIPIEESSAENVATALSSADAVSPSDWEAMSRRAALLAQSNGAWADVAARVTSFYRG